MSSSIRTPATRVLNRAMIAAGLLIPVVAIASPASDALRRQQADSWVSRSTALSDLGITAPVVLDNGDSRHDFYLPVPKGVVLDNAAITFDARYLKGESGRTNLVLSVDGQPVSAENIADGSGLVNRNIPVQARARSNGFVRLGVDWHSNVGLRQCESNRSTANALTILPESRLTYRYDSASVSNLDDAWSTLPGSPTLLVASNSLEKQTFDSAWRIGVALERSGKRVIVKAFPSVGDEIDTRALSVPGGLAPLPAFAGLAGHEHHKIANAAEIGALLVLNAPAVAGDVVIADPALRGKLNEALDALKSQLAADADALEAFNAWRQERAPLAASDLQARQIRLTSLGKQPVIAIAPDAGAQAAGVFDAYWRRILSSRQVTVQTATPPNLEDRQAVRLMALGGSSDSFDVVAKGDWTANFALSAVSVDGRMPAELVIDVASAPGASSTRPVASVFWNGILLGAKQLDADGRAERITARVPGYVLGVNNSVRVSFQRQPVSVDCNEVPQGYPVNVLPSSHVKPGDAEPDGTFVGLLPLMAGSPQLIVPESYLAAAPDNIKRVIGIASASGLSPTRAELTVAAAGQPVKPSKPFLSMEVALDGFKPKVLVTDNTQLRIDGKDTPWLDITGLQRLSTAEVARSSDQHGMLWNALGKQTGTLDQPFVLNRGNVAIIGPNGPVAWIDSSNPDASQPPGAGESAFFEWRRYISWGVPAISFALLAFLLILILALRASRKNRKSH
ncbi:cellulose biosynthesis cyclic di-GMP-binding regulatory protein BcsB [Achromobacter deleyi]|uniref:cellulose biosynthesis cyclic di-GMP-binding regulatory protein BcsB n=1 Tax=Achromobacter deleyi TaxID=1353891 RepID=UPI001491C210|nr:cellulose biosynthesis cyclic di-GMP-binding regulatory protein BcsB [Achromobacter deleyi]QVQ28240.1 cellulose biosynthesis cyclic di-GMP-binding regulatory protein BcsB [Achromobacter deleyi]UIP18435.1 cellulose biosynthesis cyclic di-GMP-binding regulatory protein BcsB [Achromobacter deleyi]